MSKIRSRKRDLISVEKYEDMGFTDGYTGVKSREMIFIKEYVKRNINNDEIIKRIVSYNLGYKKGVIIANGVNKTKLKDNELSINGEPIKISEGDISYLYNSINELKNNFQKKKTRR